MKGEIKMEDYIYRLEEIRDEEFTTIKNVKKVIEEQNKLVELVVNADKDLTFKSFVDKLSESIENYKKQIETLEQKANLLNRVIELSDDDRDIKESINMLIEAIGLFK